MSEVNRVKVCVHCAMDCSGKPRVKDTQGRYSCQACVNRLAAQALEASRRAEAPSAVATAEPGDDEADLYSLAEPEVAAVATPTQQMGCPECGAAMKVTAVLCVSCGYQVKTGSVAQTAIGAAVHSPASSKERQRHTKDQAELRKAYMIPIIMTVACVAIASVITGGDQEQLLIWGLSLVFTSVLGMGVYLFLCSVWLGLNNSLKLTMVQLVGIFAATDMVRALMSPLRYAGMIGLAAIMVGTGLTFGGLMVKLMDLDLEDGLVAGPVCYVLPNLVAVYLAMAIVVSSGS